jgi:hypothetical protein
MSNPDLESLTDLESPKDHTTPAVPPRKKTFRQRHLVPLTLLIVTIGLFHWPVLSRVFTLVDNAPDVTNFEVPDMEVRAKALRQGVIPIWDPYAQGGRPMLAQLNPHLLDPFSTAFLLLPLRDGHIRLGLLEPYLVLLRCFAGVAAYFLLSELGLSAIACVFGGFLYAVTGITGTTAWPETIIETIYPPLVFLFLFRSLTGRRPWLNAATAGAITGLSWFSGTHHIPLVTSFAAIVTLVAAMWIEKRWRSGILRLVLYGALLAFVSAPQILPSLEMAPYVTRWVSLPEPIQGSARVPFAAHLSLAVEPEHLLGIALPGDLNLADNGMEFLGIVALAFIVLALRDWSSSRLIRFLAIVAVIGALLPVAGYNHFYGLLYTLVPAMEKLREPAYWFFLLQLAGCCLAAIGLDRFLRNRDSFRTIYPPLIRVLFAIGAVVFLAATFWGLVAEPAKQPLVHQYSFSGLIALLLATVLLLDQKKRSRPLTLGGLVIALLFMEHGDVAGHTSQAHFILNQPSGIPRFVQFMDQRGALADFLKHTPDVERIATNHEDLGQALGDFNLLEDLGGGEGTMLTQLYRLGPWNFRTQQLYGVDYYVAKKPWDPRQVLVMSSAPTGLNIYKNPGAQPRAWAVHRLAPVQTNQEYESALNNPAFDITQMAPLKGSVPALETCSGSDEVKLISRSWFHSAIDTTLACRGMVILNDHAYPGWYASVDDRSVHMFSPYGALRGVVVEAGKHRIEFHYRPWSFIIGLLLFALAIVALIIIGRLDHRREPDFLSLQLAS